MGLCLCVCLCLGCEGACGWASVPVPVHVPVPVPVTAPMCHTMPYSSTGNSSFTIALSLLCANPHSHVRATTREATRPQPPDSEDTPGYWAADSLSSSLPVSPFPPAPSVFARYFNGVPSKNLLPYVTRVASGVRCVHSAWPPLSVDHTGPVHLNSPANTYYQTRPVITMTPF